MSKIKMLSGIPTLKLDESSLNELQMLADLAYEENDRASCEILIELIYNRLAERHSSQVSFNEI